MKVQAPSGFVYRWKKGIITANAGFISGVAVEPSGVTSAITMDDLSSLISQLTASSGGTFRTASSGARVQISSAHTEQQIQFAIDAFKKCGKKYKLI